MNLTYIEQIATGSRSNEGWFNVCHVDLHAAGNLVSTIRDDFTDTTARGGFRLVIRETAKNVCYQTFLCDS